MGKKKNQEEPSINELRGRFLDLLKIYTSFFDWELTPRGQIRGMADGHIFDPLTAIAYRAEEDFIPYAGTAYECDGYYGAFAAAYKLGLIVVSEEIVQSTDFPTMSKERLELPQLC